MPSQILISIIFITLALVFYSIGVSSERLAGRLKPWHLVFFWAGLACDTTGTGIMLFWVGSLSLSIHSVTGALAILLMVVHNIWATVILIRREEQAIKSFPKFSLFVWVIWLISNLTGFFASLRR